MILIYITKNGIKNQHKKLKIKVEKYSNGVENGAFTRLLYLPSASCDLDL